jgi:hypothetical protein
VARSKALPDLLIVGDSHTAALKAGCDAHGLRAEVLGFSGNLWHAGHVVLHRTHGLWVRGAAMQARLKAVQEALGGGSLLRPDLPVLASVGFHLGRLVPPFGFRKHVSSAAEFEAEDGPLFASSALIADYAEHFRRPHIRLLIRMARQAPVTAVAPPHFYAAPNYRAFYDYLVRAIRGAGVTLYDAREDWGQDGAPLDPQYVAADGVHGNEAYSAKVVGHMLDRGLVRRRGD